MTYYLLKIIWPTDPTWFDIMTAIGAVLSVVGLTWTIIEVFQVKSKINNAKIEMKNCLINRQHFQIANEASEKINHIITSITTEKWALARQLTQDLYSDILQLENEIKNDKELDESINKIPSIINELINQESGNAIGVFPSVMTKDISKLQTLIAKYMSILNK